MFLVCVLFIAVFCQQASGQDISDNADTKIPFVEFCDLMADKDRYLDKLVKTKAVIEYRVTMEFVLYSECNSKRTFIALGVLDDIMDEILDIFTTEMNRRKEHNLTAEITGILQGAAEKEIRGFGHYAWSKYQFEIQEINNIEAAKTDKQ